MCMPLLYVLARMSLLYVCSSTLLVYAGEDRELWKQYDACELVKQYKGPKLPTLVDTGTADPFLQEQLKPERFEAACKEAGFEADIRMQDGYDHSYYFVASFMPDHVAFHAKALK